MSTGTQHGTPGSRNKANRRFDRNRARGNDQRIDRASSASTSAVQPDAAVNIAAVEALSNFAKSIPATSSHSSVSDEGDTSWADDYKHDEDPELNEINTTPLRARTDTETTTVSEDFVAVFFSERPGFTYIAQKGTLNQFHALCDFMSWDDVASREQRSHLLGALVLQFNTLYGTDLYSLEAWQGICQMMDGELIAGDVETYQEILRCLPAEHINFVDLVDARLLGGKGKAIRYSAMKPGDEFLTDIRVLYEHDLAGPLLKGLSILFVNRPASELKVDSEVVLTDEDFALHVQAEAHNAAAQIPADPADGATSSTAPSTTPLAHHILKPQSAKRTYISDYFSEHSTGYNFDPGRETIAQFRELSAKLEWSRERYKEERTKLQLALVLQFNQIYGKNANSLRGWQSLLRAVRAEKIPATLAECQEAMAHIHVNLVDLVDVGRTGIPVTVYPNVVELAEYTIDTGKIFPREHAKAGGLLALLLRRIHYYGRNFRDATQEQRQACG